MAVPAKTVSDADSSSDSQSSPSAFFDVQSNAASGGNLASIWSWWHPAAPATARYLPNLHTTTTQPAEERVEDEKKRRSVR